MRTHIQGMVAAWAVLGVGSIACGSIAHGSGAFGSVAAGSVPGESVASAAESVKPAWTGEISLREPTDAPPDEPTAPSVPRFGAAGSWWLSGGGGAAFDLEDSTDYAIHLGLSYFVADDVEVLGELAFWRFDVADDSAYGVNPSAVFRWHFVNEQSFSIYADIGIGVLLTTDDVPEGGTTFNFTPRAGMGVTFLVDETRGWRGEIGVRWAHISNARIKGNDDNPGRDSLMVYVGFIIPF